MKWTLANFYLQIIIAYICLFVVLMRMIKIAYAQVYEKVKCKVILLFVCITLILAFRWFIYLCLQFSWMQLRIENLLSEIPFYVSELAISTCYIIFLAKMYDRE